MKREKNFKGGDTQIYSEKLKRWLDLSRKNMLRPQKKGPANFEEQKNEDTQNIWRGGTPRIWGEGGDTGIEGGCPPKKNVSSFTLDFTENWIVFFDSEPIN